MTSRSSADRPASNASTNPATTTSSTPRSESRGFTWFAGVAAVLAALSVLSGVVMLILKWVGLHPWNGLTILPMVLLPVAFVLLMIALFLAARRRRSQ